LIADWCARFRNDRLATEIVTRLRGRGDEVWQRAFALLQAESPEYRNAVDDEFARESKSHCNELLQTIVAIASGKPGADTFAFVRGHAQWRARRHVPLIASLHAYRLAHRIYWALSREALQPRSKERAAMQALTMLSDFWIELFDHVGAVLAAAHAVEESVIVAEGTTSYVALIDDLLRGRPLTEAPAQRLASLCGIRAGAPLAVAVLRPREVASDPSADFEIALRALVRLLEEVLPPARFGRLIDIRGGEVVAIVCCDAAPGRGLAEALRRSPLARRSRAGNAALIGGISRDTRAIEALPQALEEAKLALEFAGSAQPVELFADIDLRESLMQRASATAFRLIPDWVQHFGADADGPSRELLRTIRAFGDCSFNVKQTARRVGVHTNTIYFRLNRIKQLTGIDPRTYAGTARLLTTLRLVELGQQRGANSA